MRLSDGHLARVPYGAIKSQRPSLPRTPVYLIYYVSDPQMLLELMKSEITLS